MTGKIIYWFVEEYALFLLLIAFYNITHLNKTGAGYASFAMSILFLALYTFVVVFLLIAFACRKVEKWPSLISNAHSGVHKSRISMFIKIILYYGKWMLFALLISMDEDIQGKLQLTILFVIHGLSMVAECGLCYKIYEDFSVSSTNVIMNAQI